MSRVLAVVPLRRLLPRVALAAAIQAALSCGGSIGQPSGDIKSGRENTVIWNKDGGQKDGPPGPTPDAVKRVDLTAKAGDPCTYGKCGPNLICMANICMTMCNQPLPGCNDKVAACTAGEACMYASDFTDCCYPATAKEGQPCDVQKAIYCVQGTVCVKVGTKAPACLRLCKYTCPTGSYCGKTNTGCDVCIK